LDDVVGFCFEKKIHTGLNQFLPFGNVKVDNATVGKMPFDKSKVWQ
jgi:hypothetical protein